MDNKQIILTIHTLISTIVNKRNMSDRLRGFTEKSLDELQKKTYSLSDLNDAYNRGREDQRNENN